MKPIRNGSVKTSILPDGFVALHDLDRDLACTLSPIGAIVWELCDGTHSVDSIVSEVIAFEELRALMPPSIDVAVEIPSIINHLQAEQFLLTE